MTDQTLQFRLFSEDDTDKYQPGKISFADFNRFNGEVAAFLSGQKDKEILHKISPNIQSGSFVLSIVLCGAIQSQGLLSDLSNISDKRNLHIVDKNRINVFEKWQRRALGHKDNQVSISIGDNSFLPIKITSEGIYNFDDIWVEVEDYFIGEIYNAGGKNKPNIHLTLTGSDKDIKVATNKALLKNLEHLHLYNTFRVYVSAKQNIITKEYKNLKLLELIKWDSDISVDAMKRTGKIIKTAFRNVTDISEWISEMRG